MQQAADFLEESHCLAAVIEPLSPAQLMGVTQFMNWTVKDIIGHLHMFNHAANLAIKGDRYFNEFFDPMAEDLNAGKSLLSVQNTWLGDIESEKLIGMWQHGFDEVARSFGNADPARRIAWAGPQMSARSSITARQMETWAHGQAVFDMLGQVREDGDRIRNIVHLGISTHGWTFKNRKLEIPQPAPYVVLESPSGDVWEWNEPQSNNRVTGSAVEFCQIVAQTRNVADTDIITIGETAQQWMATAQCFAGPPVDVPKAGTRFRVIF